MQNPSEPQSATAHAHVKGWPLHGSSAVLQRFRCVASSISQIAEAGQVPSPACTPPGLEHANRGSSDGGVLTGDGATFGVATGVGEQPTSSEARAIVRITEGSHARLRLERGLSTPPSVNLQATYADLGIDRIRANRHLA